MLEEKIREYAAGKGFHPRTLDRWLRWDETDRDALFNLAFILKLSENHLRDFMDWLEEIALRDGIRIHDILNAQNIDRVATAPRLSRGDKLKRIKDEVRRVRFPRLSQTEDAIQNSIRTLKLPSRVKISVPTGLEGETLSVEIKAASHEELKQLAGKLAEAVQHREVEEIFNLLRGIHTQSE